MIQRVAKTEAERICAEALIETDRQYFELAAELQPLSVGTLAWMPGLTDLAASCVVHRIDSADVRSLDADWISEVESCVAQRSVRRVRIYMESCPSEFHDLMSGLGYQQRVEFGFLGDRGHCQLMDDLRLREVLTDEDWGLKLALHRDAMDGPDGYVNKADLWVEMERRKCATGQMRAFLVERDSQVTGAVGAMIHGDLLLRLKNIVVAPQHRRTGVGHATVQLLRRMAQRDYNCPLGVFGVQGGYGSHMYRRAGLNEMTYQVEWSRLIGEE